MGGLLLALGLFTRTVAFILAGDMAVAYFMAAALGRAGLRRDNMHPALTEGRAAVITGGASGIGLAAAKRFASLSALAETPCVQLRARRHAIP